MNKAGKIEHDFSSKNTKKDLSYKKINYWLFHFAAILILLLSFIGVKAYYTLYKPVLGATNLESGIVSLQVEKGDRLKSIQDSLNIKNTYLENLFLNLYLKFSNLDKKLQSGYYEFQPNTSFINILEKISNGEVKINKFQILEGSTVKNILSSLQNAQGLVQTLPYDRNISANELAKMLGIKFNSAEGVFFPDTYYYSNGDTDKDVLLKAFNTMQDNLQKAWKEKDIKKFNKYSKKYLVNPYDVLRLAAIVEKEAADKADREKVAGVFLLRLNKNMRLQADPTVIYSLQDEFKGDIKKHHLKKDSPFNTYVKKGLPPAPISTVSLESINAVLHPNITGDLFFVASGDGKTHLFSKNIKQHNTLVKNVLLK